MGSVGAFAPLGASVFGCNVSYNYAQLCAFPAVAGSFRLNAPERLTGKFAADSSLEEGGFELVVPL